MRATFTAHSSPVECGDKRFRSTTTSTLFLSHKSMTSIDRMLWQDFTSIDKMFSEMFQSTQPDYASLRREFLISSTLRTTRVRLGSFQLSNDRLHKLSVGVSYTPIHWETQCYIPFA